MSMAFVCDQCEAELASGEMACPRCGQPFDTPVPDIATYREPDTDGPAPSYSARPAGSPPAPVPEPMPLPFPKKPPPDRNGLSVGIFLALLVLACLFWLGRNGAFGPGGGYLPSSLGHGLGH